MSAHWLFLEKKKKTIPSGFSYTIQRFYCSCSYFLYVSYIFLFHFTHWYQYSKWGLTSTVEKHTLTSMCSVHHTFANTSPERIQLVLHSNSQLLFHSKAALADISHVIAAFYIFLSWTQFFALALVELYLVDFGSLLQYIYIILS